MCAFSVHTPNPDSPGRPASASALQRPRLNISFSVTSDWPPFQRGKTARLPAAREHAAKFSAQQQYIALTERNKLTPLRQRAHKGLIAQNALDGKTGPERNQIAAPRKHGIVDIAPFPGPAWNQRAACLRRASALLEAVVVIQERIDMVVILECAGALCAGLQAPRISIRGARALV